MPELTALATTTPRLCLDAAALTPAPAVATVAGARGRSGRRPEKDAGTARVAEAATAASEAMAAKAEGTREGAGAGGSERKKQCERGREQCENTEGERGAWTGMVGGGRAGLGDDDEDDR
jgi:hypothetical protein